RTCSAVHPRACGEHVMPVLLRTGGWRFIPAHAGNTSLKLWEAAAIAVHPRACGEHIGCCFPLLAVLGSSPRMRGTRRATCDRTRRCRFIPAHAGNTRMRTAQARRAAVHPRACGEHARRCGRGNVANGSSPRMRGTLFVYALENTRKIEPPTSHRTKQAKKAR